MTHISSLSLCCALFLGSLILSSCDSAESKLKPSGTGIDTKTPPPQKAIYLRARHERPPGTEFTNTRTLTMKDADVIVRRGEDVVNGTSRMMMREKWDVEQLSPNERVFVIEEMSLGYDSVIGGSSDKQRSASTLIDVPFKVDREGEGDPWVLEDPETPLASLQESEVRMLGKLWADSTEKLYPEGPLDIGESWNPDPKAFGMIVSPRLEIIEGEVTCTLEEITVLRGERCGKIGVDVDITGVLNMSGSDGIKVQIALTGQILRSLHKNYDMRTELTGTMQTEMEFPDEDTTISIDGVAEFLQLAEMIPAKPE